MNLLKSVKILFWGIVVALIANGCSPSSSGSRYNKPPEKEKEAKTSSVRFTSEGDTTKSDKVETGSYYNRPEFDELPVEENPVDAKEFIRKYEKFGEISAALTPREKILFEIVRFLDTPYKYGGNSEKGIDCSAFTQQVYDNTLGIKLPRSASEQYKVGEKISNKTSLQFGDLIFFDTRSSSYPGHVGIYIGEDMFVHASRSQGVIVSSLKSSYYAARFISARRVEKTLIPKE